MTQSALRRHVTSAAAVCAVTLVLAACSAGNESSAPADGGGSSLSGSIAGAGASSQAAAQEAWRAGFSAANPQATVNYDPIGSGGGRKQFISGGSDFGGTDAYLDEKEMPGAQARCGGEVIEVPLYVSPIAIVYNLKGVDDLQLKPATAAKIFKQEIKKWNDPAIAADNPGAQLPDLAITPVNRSDESGTTENFTDYLKAAAPEVWTFEVSGDWPVPGGEAAQGTSGVVGAVGAGEGSVGYADESQAGDLGVAKVGVGNEFVGPTAEAAAKILESSQRVPGSPESVFTYDLKRDTTESGTYPVVLVSYLMACGKYDSQGKADLVKSYLTYMASEDGQKAAQDAAGSAPIPASLRDQIQPVIDKISAGA